jgi:hypothetical protein
MYQKWCLQGLAFLRLIENAKCLQNADRGAQGKEADLIALIIKSRMTRVLTTTQMGCMHKPRRWRWADKSWIYSIGVDRTDTNAH